MITTHAAYSQLKEIAEKEKTSIHIVLANELERQRKEKKFETLTELTKDMHLYPDLHGEWVGFPHIQPYKIHCKLLTYLLILKK